MTAMRRRNAKLPGTKQTPNARVFCLLQPRRLLPSPVSIFVLHGDHRADNVLRCPPGKPNCRPSSSFVRELGQRRQYPTTTDYLGITTCYSRNYQWPGCQRPPTSSKKQGLGHGEQGILHEIVQSLHGTTQLQPVSTAQLVPDPSSFPKRVAQTAEPPPHQTSTMAPVAKRTYALLVGCVQARALECFDCQAASERVF